MSRTKETRSPFGSILPKKITLNGKKVTVYDARKRYTDADGKPAQKFKRCYTTAEAQTALLNFPAEIAAAAALAAEQKEKEKVLTFFELTDYFEKEYLIEAVFAGERQIAGYRQDTKNILAYIKNYKEFFGDVPVESLTYESVRAYHRKIATTPIRPPQTGEPEVLPKISTVNRKLAYLRRILNVGIQLRGQGTNPFNLGKPLINTGAETPRERVLTYDEEVRLLAACEGPDEVTYTRAGKKITAVFKDNPRAHLKLIVIFAIESGMRKAEIFTTTRRQIDLGKMVLTLNARQTKALKKRAIPVSDRLKVEIEKLLEGKTYKPDDLLFDGIKNCRTAFAKACERAKIENLTFHDLRHTAATWMDEAGISQAVRMNVVGHTSERVHQRYNNTSDDIIASTREKLNDFRRKLEEKRKTEAEKKVA